MSKAYDTYCQTVRSVEIFSSVYKDCVKKNPTSGTNYDDLLRGEYVLLVSAYETYLHQLISEKIFDDIETAESVKKSDASDAALLDFYLRQLDYFQNAEDKKEEVANDFQVTTLLKMESVSSAFRLMLKIENFKEKLFDKGKFNTDFENNYNGVIERRNQIVHESDMDNKTRLKRTISVKDISDLKQTLCSIIETIENNIDLWYSQAKLAGVLKR